MKITIKIIIILMVLVSCSDLLCAQSMYWSDLKKSEYVRKAGPDIYQTESAKLNSSYYKIVNNTCLLYKGDEELAVSGMFVYAYKKLDNRIEFFRDGKLVGYAVPSLGRFYYITLLPDGESEEDMGVLLNGTFYGSDGKARFTIDEGFPLEAAGIFIFMVS